jgi:hypothetical protein
MKSTRNAIAIAAATLPAIAGNAFAATYSAASDFSATANPSGPWTYGQLAGTAFSAFDLVEQFGDPAAHFWHSSTPTPFSIPYVGGNQTNHSTSSGTAFLGAGEMDFHPGASGQLGVVRFTTPESGLYQIAATFSDGDTSSSGGTIVSITIGGTQMFSGAVPGSGISSPSYSATQALTAGEIVDFRVDANGSFSNDATRLSAVITSVPEPASALLLLLGIVTVAKTASKRKT